MTSNKQGIGQKLVLLLDRFWLITESLPQACRFDYFFIERYSKRNKHRLRKNRSLIFSLFLVGCVNSSKKLRWR